MSLRSDTLEKQPPPSTASKPKHLTFPILPEYVL